jgi:hypothetical protein
MSTFFYGVWHVAVAVGLAGGLRIVRRAASVGRRRPRVTVTTQSQRKYTLLAVFWEHVHTLHVGGGRRTHKQLLHSTHDDPLWDVNVSTT